MNSHQSSMFFYASILLTSAYLMIEMTSCLNAQPTLIHLSLAADNKSDETNSVIVTWLNDKTEGDQYVKYGLKPDTHEIIKASKDNFYNKNIFSAVLEKMEQGSRYYYKCGSEADGWSSEYSFYSEPNSGAFRVAIIGDTQDDSENTGFSKTKLITNHIRSYSPSFTLHMGDIVNNGSISASWVGFLSSTQELNAVSPLMPVLGNHDIQNEQGEEFQKPFHDFISLFNLPGDEVNYSFTYENVRFISIFSGCAQSAAKTDEIRYKPASPEYIWLKKELSETEKDKNIAWIIVWMHYPVKSFGWSYVPEWSEAVLPLLEKYHVNLCLAGHRHIYERHFQMKDGIPVKNISRSTFSASDGTVYITNGTAGGNPTGLGGKDQPDMAFTPEKTMYSFAIMDVNRDSINYSVFDQDNILVDRFVIQKRAAK